MQFGNHSFAVFLFIAGAFWLICLAAIGASFVLGSKPTQSRFTAALVCAALAMAVSFLALNRLQITYTRTVNGSSWTLNSRYFFLIPIVLGSVALLWILLRRLTLKTR